MITPEQLAEHDIQVFLEHYNITNDQGQKLDFLDHPFMWDIFNDWSPKMCAPKAAQITFSTTAIHKLLWLSKHKKLDIIYSLPTAGDINDFVSAKVNRLIANNPIYQTWTEDKDSIVQKRVGTSTIYFRGTWTDRAALMIPADVYIADEVDRSNQINVEQFASRLQHSKYQWEWRFSNPSAPGVGVDKWWQQSDQKHWFITCDACGHEWYLTMENVMEKEERNFYFGCTKCRAELNRRKGRWIKRWKDREISGYHISLLMAPWVSANKIMELKESKSEEYFANMVLGEPYIGRGNTLTSQMLFQNLTSLTNPQDTRPIIGVDTGVDIRYTIGNASGIFYYGQCKDYNELEHLLKRWENAIMVIDQGGDIVGPRKLREKYPNRVYLCFFSADRKNDELIRWRDEDCTVMADRNKMIQLVVDEFTEKRIPLYGTEAEWWDYWLHWSHIYRTAEEDSLGVVRYKWLRSDRDDWALATVYWRIGMSRFMEEKKTTFHGAKATFGSVGLDVRPDGSAFLPKKL